MVSKTVHTLTQYAGLLAAPFFWPHAARAPNLGFRCLQTLKGSIRVTCLVYSIVFGNNWRLTVCWLSLKLICVCCRLLSVCLWMLLPWLLVRHMRTHFGFEGLEVTFYSLPHCLETSTDFPLFCVFFSADKECRWETSVLLAQITAEQCWASYSNNVIYYSLLVTPFKSNIVTLLITFWQQ